MPTQNLLWVAAFQFISLAALISVEYIDEIGLATGSDVSAVAAEWYSPVCTVGFVVEHSLANYIGDVVDLYQWVLWGCCESLIIVAETYIGYSATMGDDGLTQWLIGLPTEQWYGAIIASNLIQIYSPPTKNSTELLLSQAAAQYYSDELDLEEMLVMGTAVFL